MTRSPESQIPPQDPIGQLVSACTADMAFAVRMSRAVAYSGTPLETLMRSSLTEQRSLVDTALQDRDFCTALTDVTRVLRRVAGGSTNDLYAIDQPLRHRDHLIPFLIRRPHDLNAAHQLAEFYLSHRIEHRVLGHSVPDAFPAMVGEELLLLVQDIDPSRRGTTQGGQAITVDGVKWHVDLDEGYIPSHQPMHAYFTDRSMCLHPDL